MPGVPNPKGPGSPGWGCILLSLELVQGRSEEISAERVFQAAEEGDAGCKAIVKEGSLVLGD